MDDPHVTAIGLGPRLEPRTVTWTETGIPVELREDIDEALEHDERVLRTVRRSDAARGSRPVKGSG